MPDNQVETSKEELPPTTSNVIEALDLKKGAVVYDKTTDSPLVDKPKTEPNPIGRPTVFTPETISKLEQVFALGGTDLEACFFAGIGKTALYNYQNENPEFVERKEALKEKPFLKARQTIISALDNPVHAQWYMERKKKKEFALRIENTGADGKDLVPLTPEQQEKLNGLLIAKNGDISGKELIGQ